MNGVEMCQKRGYFKIFLPVPKLHVVYHEAECFLCLYYKRSNNNYFEF